jgi:hypothetical protein
LTETDVQPARVNGGPLGESRDDNHKTSIVPRVLDLAGAAAGLVVLIGLVGRFVVWARLHAVGLPATPGVSFVSADELLSIGAGTLSASLIVGAAAVAALYGIRSALSQTTPKAQLAGYIVLACTLEALLIAFTAASQVTWDQRLLEWTAGLLAGLVLVVVANNATIATRRVGLIFFFVIATLGAVVGIVRDYGPPASFDEGVIFLKDGSVTTGAYLGADSANYYVAPDLFGKVYGQIAAIPRADTARLTLTQPYAPYVSVGNSYPDALIGNSVTSTDHLTSLTDDWIAAQVGSLDWRYPPLTYDASAEYLETHPQQYFGNVLRAPAAETAVRLATLVNDPGDYAGEAVVTSGQVVGSAPVPYGAASPTGQFVTVRDSHNSGAELFCYSRARPAYTAGTRLLIHGLMIAAGVVQRLAAGSVHGVYVLCSGTGVDKSS